MLSPATAGWDSKNLETALGGDLETQMMSDEVQENLIKWLRRVASV
jgi:hypothetical protein